VRRWCPCSRWKSAGPTWTCSSQLSSQSIWGTWSRRLSCQGAPGTWSRRLSCQGAPGTWSSQLLWQAASKSRSCQATTGTSKTTPAGWYSSAATTSGTVGEWCSCNSTVILISKCTRSHCWGFKSWRSCGSDSNPGAFWTMLLPIWYGIPNNRYKKLVIYYLDLQGSAWPTGSRSIKKVADLQCFGSAYAEYGSGSRALAEYWYRTRIRILDPSTWS